MNRYVSGVLGAFAIHLVFALLIMGLVFFFTSSFDDASEQLLLQLGEAEDAEAQVLSYLSTARGELMTWVFPVLGIGWLASIVFLIRAEMAMPGTPREGAAHKGFWTILMLVAMIMGVVMWYINLSVPQVGYALQSGNYAIILFSGFAAILLAYFFSTALFVKKSMRASVPLAELIKGSR